jgi:hypothetical protein
MLDNKEKLKRIASEMAVGGAMVGVGGAALLLPLFSAEFIPLAPIKRDEPEERLGEQKPLSEEQQKNSFGPG